MENPDRDARVARDQFIRALNSPIFDTSSDAHQQEFMRHMANRMKITDDALNALVRQTWDRRGPVPVLRPLRVEEITIVAPAFRSAKSIFEVRIQDMPPAEIMKWVRITLQDNTTDIDRINAYFKTQMLRRFVPRVININDNLILRYVTFPDQFQIGMIDIFPRELNVLSIPMMGKLVPDRVLNLKEFPNYIADMKIFLAYLDLFEQDRSVQNSIEARELLRQIFHQLTTYMQKSIQDGTINLIEYVTNMRAWRDQLTILSRRAFFHAPVPIIQHNIESAVTFIPGGLLPSNPVSQTSIFTTVPENKTYSNQPLSPSATRKNSSIAFNNPNVTFVQQTQKIYLRNNSKEIQQIEALFKAAQRLSQQERDQPRNVRPLYRMETERLANDIDVYWRTKQHDAIDLYDYINQVQSFTDRLHDLQSKIAARPVPRYHPDLDPEFLYEPAGLRASKVTVGQMRHLAKMLEVLQGVANDELNNFGREGVFVEDIDFLIRDLQDQLAYLLNDQGRTITMQEYLTMLRNWRDTIQNLIDERRALGRRCINDADPWDSTPIIEIPDNEYIRLSNGMCWHIQSLMEYIRGVDGENTSKDLPGYASPRIWEDEADAKRIINHDFVKADKDFRQYFMNILYGGNANKISDRTLEMLYRTASLFVSRGKPFDEALQKALTPQQYAIFMRYTQGDAYKRNKIPVDQQREEIETAINLILKSDATHHFWEYYEQLSAEEKAALKSFRKDFEDSLRQCRFGKNNRGDRKLCVYVMANVILPIVYRVAEIKGLHFPPLDTKEQ